MKSSQRVYSLRVQTALSKSARGLVIDSGDIGLWVSALFGISFAVIIFVVRPWTIPDLRTAAPAHD